MPECSYAGEKRDRNLNVELVLPSLQIGGMEAFAVRLARALSGLGHDVGVTCTDDLGPLRETLIENGHRVALIPVGGLVSNLAVGRLKRWFQELRPDVIHIQSTPWLKVARAARKAGVPNIGVTVHGITMPERPYHLWMQRWAARYTDWIAAVAEPTRAYLTQVADIPPSRVDVCLNGVNTDHFRPGSPSQEFRDRIGAASSSIVVGTVARLAIEKNHAMLLEAFRLLVKRHVDAHLVLVGDGPLRPAIERFARQEELEARVHLFGAIADTASVYRELDIFALSSANEGSSMSILEAMASGLAIVATSVGGTPALLADGDCGILVDANDPHRLADKLYELSADRNSRGGLGARARLRAEHEYGEAQMVRRYEARYRRVYRL